MVILLWVRGRGKVGEGTPNNRPASAPFVPDSTLDSRDNPSIIRSTVLDQFRGEPPLLVDRNMRPHYREDV